MTRESRGGKKKQSDGLQVYYFCGMGRDVYMVFMQRDQGYQFLVAAKRQTTRPIKKEVGQLV